MNVSNFIFKMFTNSFLFIDYAIFLATLLISASIGIYFGCFGSKQKTATEYLYGQGSAKIVPIGLSLYSSAVSAIAIIGAPTEVYSFGMQFVLVYVGTFFSFIVTWTFVLPVFCKETKFSTPYEYYERRFNYKICVLSVLIYVLQTFLFLPAVLYSATASFSEISGISITTTTSVVGGICVIYTVLGGFSAVIWSDTLQATLMILSCVFIMIKGIINVGGFDVMWQRAEEGHRINIFSMDINPFKKITFWSSTIGMLFLQAAHSGCTAGSIQRYMALKNVKQAKISTLVSVTTMLIFGVVICFIGLAMFAQYYNCDPVSNKDIPNTKKLLFHYVAFIVKDTPGFLGFFNAGILCAGLSTLSAELNTTSGLIYHCVIKKFYNKSFGEKKGAIIMKILVLVNGILYLILAPLLDKAQYVFSLALGLAGVTYCAKLSMIILGVAFPKTNSLGVFCGVISGMLLTTWINIGSIYYNITETDVLPFSTENCIKNNLTEVVNSTLEVISNTDKPFIIYKLSFLYYPLVGSIMSIIVGLIVSYISGPNDPSKIDPSLFINFAKPKVTYKEVALSDVKN